MHGVVCNNLLEIWHTFLVDYQVEGQAAWLVGRKVDKGRWVEQGLVSGLDKKIVRELGKLER